MRFEENKFSAEKDNFAFIHLSYSTRSCDIEVIKDIVQWSSNLNAYYICPLRLFREIVQAGKSFLKDCDNKLKVKIPTEKDLTFSTSYTIGAPWTVTFKNKRLQDIEIDFVPAIVLTTNKIRRCEDKLNSIRSDFIHRSVKYNEDKDFTRKETKNLKEFLGISLHKADSKQFEMDFHNFERAILYRRNYAKNVIKLIKFMRNNHQGPLQLLSSHMIKTVVMEKTLEDEHYWEDVFKLESNFYDCMELLLLKIFSGKVNDIFFPSVNLLSVKFKDLKTVLLRISQKNVQCMMTCESERKYECFKSAFLEDCVPIAWVAWVVVIITKLVKKREVHFG